MAKAAFEGATIIGFKNTQRGVEQLAFGHDDDVKARRDLIMTENLSNQTFSSISPNRATELLRGRDSQSTNSELVGQDKERAVATVDAGAVLVGLLKIGAAADPLVRAEFHSLLTVSRFRPFARRRFSTNRPFLVLMRTRNPCVRLRWRVLG